MNILLIGTGIPTESMRGVGGAGAVVISIAETLSKTDKVYVIPWWSEKPTILRRNLVKNGVEYIRRRITLEVVYLMMKGSFSGSFKAATKYAHGLNKIKYALLYTFDRAHIEATLRLFKIDVVHVHGPTLPYLPYIEAAIEEGTPLVCTCHGICTLNPDINLDFDKSFEKDILRRISDADRTEITTVSTQVREQCINHFGISPDRIRVVLNGVDHDRFHSVEKAIGDLREQYSIPQDKIVLLQVGTLSKLKNHSLVLRALAEMDNEIKGRLLYVIVGDGKERKTLSSIIKENRLDACVFFMGWTDRNLPDMYRLANFFILPSTSEGLPMVFLESMAAGLPIITFADLEGVADIFNPDCIELIPDRDVKSVIMTIQSAIEREWNREKIVKHSNSFNWGNVCEAYRNTYKELIDHERQ